MKKSIITLVIAMVAMSCFAQSKSIEPEYIGQVVILNTDSTTTLLQKETAKMKAKSSKWGMLPIPGAGMLDKSKVKLTIKGSEAPVKVKAGPLTLVIKTGNNEKDPKEVFGVWKLEVEKKARTFLMAEAGFLSGVTATTNYNNVPFVAKKYGEDCYIIFFDNIEPGEYAVNTDFANLSTFSVQ